MLIGDISRHNARRYPAKPAVVYGDTTLSWAAVDERANRLATYLLSRGIEKGDRVAVCVRNTAEWPELTYGLAKAGLVLVPLNIRLAPAEIEFIVGDSGCRAAIVHTDQAEVAADALATLGTVLEIGGSELGVNYEQAIAVGRAADPTPGTLRADDPHVLLYTSGTTGLPKGVINVHRGMLAQTLDTTIATRARHEDIGLATTPFFTTGGMVRSLTWLYLGQTVVIHPGFDPHALVEAIERHRITTTTFIPTMLIRTLNLLDDEPGHDLSSLRRISYGGAPVTRELIARALHGLGCDMQQRYGLTEAGGQVTLLTPEDHRGILAGDEALQTSCGRETAQTEIRVVDESGNEVAPGTIGELVIKADSQAIGYWNQPEATARTFRADGVWSGDQGWRDERGYIHISGRITDMIISGGFNVYPAELERVIGSHPGVDLVSVVGLPHPEWGETPVAVIVPKQDMSRAQIESELTDLCRAKLAGYKQPRAFEFRREMPLGPAGKVLKRELRSSLTTQVE